MATNKNDVFLAENLLFRIHLALKGIVEKQKITRPSLFNDVSLLRDISLYNPTEKADEVEACLELCRQYLFGAHITKSRYISVVRLLNYKGVRKVYVELQEIKKRCA